MKVSFSIVFGQQDPQITQNMALSIKNHFAALISTGQVMVRKKDISVDISIQPQQLQQ